jgi:hypothetical protein
MRVLNWFSQRKLFYNSPVFQQKVKPYIKLENSFASLFLRGKRSLQETTDLWMWNWEKKLRGWAGEKKQKSTASLSSFCLSLAIKYCSKRFDLHVSSHFRIRLCLLEFVHGSKPSDFSYFWIISSVLNN